MRQCRTIRGVKVALGGCLLLLCISVCVAAARNRVVELRDYDDHPCARICEDGAFPRRCEYEWTVELYYAMSKACYGCPQNLSDCSRPHCVPGDGTPRAIYTVNRRMPGPAIQVCEGDEIVVNVHNSLVNGLGVTIHWHGHRQRGSQLNDGANLITQCPISQQSTFQYRFKANDSGTHWWHSHTGFQRSYGLYGALVTRQAPSRNPHRNHYDHDKTEHVILLADWIKEMTEDRFAEDHHLFTESTRPHTLLINGQGAYVSFPDQSNNTRIYTPRAEFMVESGMRYRFRVISNTFTDCPIRFSIDDHNLTLIASDGEDFEPVTVESFEIDTGERYDFVLRTYATTPEASRNYWIRVKGLGDCEDHGAHQEAVLRYVGEYGMDMPQEETTYAAAGRAGLMLNTWADVNATEPVLALMDMNSICPEDDVEDDNDELKEVPDKIIYIAMEESIHDNYHYNHPRFYPMENLPENKHMDSPQLNFISFVLPPAPPLTQFLDIDEKQFCNKETLQVRCEDEYCQCTHRVKVKVGEVVEMVIVNEAQNSDEAHTMHLHGYHFRVVALERLGRPTTVAEVKKMDKEGEIHRKLNRTVVKDTITVPDGGYIIIRLLASNTGMWLLHCHFQFHNLIGMNMLLQVGEPQDFPPRPKHWPVCGSFHYSTYDDGDDDYH